MGDLIGEKQVVPIQEPGRLGRRREARYAPKVTLRDSGPSFHRWMKEIVEVIPLDARDPKTGARVEATTRQRITRIADALAKRGHSASINTIYGYLDKKGASVYRVWDLGNALREIGVRWMSGPLALSAVHEYRWHLLGWFGTLLAPGPTATIHSMWPYLRRVICDFEVAYPPGKRHYYLPLAATLGFTYPIDQKSIDEGELVLTKRQLDLVESAWSRWIGRRQETNEFPEMVRLNMMLNRFIAEGLHGQMTQSIAQHYLAQWMVDVETNWERVNKRFLLIDQSLQ